MSDTKDKNCKRSQDRCEVAYDFNHFKFSSNETDTFRASVTTVADGVTLWLESKKSKTQWQETFKSIAECGPAGVPEDAVVAFLKRAFEGLQAENADLKAGNDEPELDLKMIGGEAVLTLTMSVGGIWKPKFVFSLLPVGLDKLDILEAKLRDAQEEIQHLRAGSTVTYFSVCSAVACQPNQTVVWNGTSPREICSSQFVLSEDDKTVTILKEGVYQLNVRLSGPCQNNSTYFNLHCNGNILFDSFSNNANGYNMSACITQVLRLKKNDILHVVWMSNYASHGAATSNNFSLLLLGK